ncbi:MAG: dethiobiotin synthase [Alphaproteobacteria bacterium]|nr:dethiobiotin synthase [Alphaproteobacteria bacterium]
MLNSVFITATGTEVGKTLVTAALTWQLRQVGKAVFSCKPMATGFDMAHLPTTDTGILLTAQGMDCTIENINTLTPWRYTEPISPHFAVMQEEVDSDNTTTPKDVLVFCENAMAHKGISLIEGAGGVMTPLLNGFTQADLIEKLHIPAIVVTGNYLGAISHCLCTLEAMQARGIDVCAVIVNATQEDGTSLQQMQTTLAQHMKKAIPLFTVPYISHKKDTEIWKQLPLLTEIFSHE